ncbi:hypothetical protein CCR75_006715 [Bremia lactucae]|uniref:PHD-type domain-containing protein n=1 Tax=Bremia lactucae TaxID=4779 RepID=A0A976FEX1_BRELC|nr:hypothetical protein CCR75_006715 [Bremia lactucae]
MPRIRKSTQLSSERDDSYAPPASARRPSITIKPRQQRERRAPMAFSPMTDRVTRKPRKLKNVSPLLDSDKHSLLVTPPRPEYKRLERKIKSQAHRLRYPLSFIEAYEAEGWNKSSHDKLKPGKELEVEHRKLITGQRALIEGLNELKTLYAHEPQVPPMAVFEDVHCSRCGSTEIEQDNDILLCDSPGCHRAYHQRCQMPIILTCNIPQGEDLWFCEVCLAIFECLKSINSVFGTTYESIDALFPELNEEELHIANDGRNSATPEEENVATARSNEDDDEEEDEDFVCEDEESDEDEEDPFEKENGNDDEMVEEVPESAQDLLYLRKEDVIDLNHRSLRSANTGRPLQHALKKVNLIGKSAAKIDSKTGRIVLGIVAELDPPVAGRYSRWRIDYCDGTSALLTRNKTQAAIDQAAGICSNDDSHESEILTLRGKRKRNEVDYRQLNELMFAGKDEDSEDDDENFEVREESEEEPDEEQTNEKNEVETSYRKDKNASATRKQNELSSITATSSRDTVSQPSINQRSQRQRQRVDYHSMHEGLHT